MANEKVTGDRLSTERVQILENLHSNLARMMALSFSTIQRSVVDCDIKFVHQTTYGEFVATLSNPTCSYTFLPHPLGGHAILDFSLPVAYAFIDRYFGGSGGNPPSEGRPLTPIERIPMTKVARRSLADLEGTWETLLKVQVREAELETNPEFMMMADSSASVLVIAFEVNSQHASGLVQLCYPFDTLAPVLKYLSLGGAPSTAGPAEPAPEVERSRQASGIPADASLEQIADDQPAVVAGVVEMFFSPPDVAADAEGARKAAVLIACLPKNLSLKVVRQCSTKTTACLEQAIDTLRPVTASDREEVFEDVRGRLARGAYVLPGAVETAQCVMKEAARSSSGFHLLRNVDPALLVPFFGKEHPQTIALIVSQLDARQGAGVMNGFSKELRADVAYRIGRMENISPLVLRELEAGLTTELESILSDRTVQVGGPKAVAEILNRTGRSTEENVLERLEAQDPEFAEDVHNQMFVFDDIAKLTDREIQVILRAVDSKDLAVSLKGACEELKRESSPT